MTEGFVFVLLLALVPALGNFAGGVLAELVAVGPNGISRALHAAAGIVIAVVAVELMPAALGGAPSWAIALAFLLGAAFYLLVEGVIQGTHKPGRGRGRGAAAMWMIYVAIATDLFSDGLLIGSGSTLSLSLAMVLALGQSPADTPEGFAAIANFKARGVSRGKRVLLSASFAVPVLIASALAYWFLSGGDQGLQLSALAFAGGFALFALVSGYFERG